MRKLYPVVAIICFACCSQPLPPPDNALKDFNGQAQTASWLYQYHSAAKPAWQHCMQTANDIREKPGFNWFGFKEKNDWHFVFGFVEDYEFSVKYHYVIDSLGRLQTNNQPIPSSFSQPWFRALLFSKSYVSKYNLPDIDYYIKRSPDSSFHVWALTTLDDSLPRQCHGYHFIFDKTASKLNSQEECPSFDSIHIDKPNQLQLFYSRSGQSPLTALLYSMKYGDQFKQVVIESPVMKSMQNTKDGKLWTHSGVRR